MLLLAFSMKASHEDTFELDKEETICLRKERKGKERKERKERKEEKKKGKEGRR